MEAIARQGLECLPWTDTAENLRQRVNWLHRHSPDNWPDWCDSKLSDSMAEWLLPYLAGMRKLADLKTLNITDILRSQLPWELQTRLEHQAPGKWQLPTGNDRDITYDPEKGPVLRARMQELYGIQQHPMIADDVPLLIEILSPANRPIQITRDLPGFWKGSYEEVAREMRGRYPKHYWPENPAQAKATTKTKRHL